MRILASVSILFAATALTVPATACDLHGAGGMFGQLGGATWTDYNPAKAETDSFLLDEKLTDWNKRNAIPSAKAKSSKPSFSKVSTRASMAAQARLAKRTKLTKQDELQAASMAKSKTSSETASR